jgi:hypothetical protein
MHNEWVFSLRQYIPLSLCILQIRFKVPLLVQHFHRVQPPSRNAPDEEYSAKRSLTQQLERQKVAWPNPRDFSHRTRLQGLDQRNLVGRLVGSDLAAAQVVHDFDLYLDWRLISLEGAWLLVRGGLTATEQLLRG